MTAPYNLAFIPVINTTDETKSRIYFFKCSIEHTNAYNRLTQWKEEYVYSAAFSLPFPNRGERYQGYHIDNTIANLIKNAHSLTTPEIFFITYLNTVLTSIILNSSVASDVAVKNISNALLDYNNIASDKLIIENNLKYVIAIGIGITSNNLHLLCIKRQILETPECDIPTIPILTYTDYSQLNKTYGDDITEVSPDVLPNVLNPYNVIIDKFNKLQRLINNISKISKTSSLEITSHDIEQYTRFTRRAIVAELIKDNNGKILSLK